MKATKMTNAEQSRYWADLAKLLTNLSEQICKDNGCTQDNHNCESYAYIREDGYLMDVCVSDYFQGCSRPHAAIPLPWTGTGTDLAIAVDNDCADMEPDQDDSPKGHESVTSFDDDSTVPNPRIS